MKKGASSVLSTEISALNENRSLILYSESTFPYEQLIAHYIQQCMVKTVRVCIGENNYITMGLVYQNSVANLIRVKIISNKCLT